MNVSFDLETLGNTSQAPIIQIGATLFTDEGKELSSFNRNCNFNSIPEGFEINYSTLGWWFGQIAKNPKLAESVSNAWDTPMNSHWQLLSSFKDWISKAVIEHETVLTYWSHATFDPPILKNNFKVAGFGNDVIPFRQFLDIRTLTHLVDGKIAIERSGHHHDALDDARTQADYVTRCLKYLKCK